MAIILDTTCWYLFPEGKVLKLRHKMNTECHKKKVTWEDTMLETNISKSH